MVFVPPLAPAVALAFLGAVGLFASLTLLTLVLRLRGSSAWRFPALGAGLSAL